ncbi:MAG: hypothetical protein JF586_11115 [Burkholderiales bacterium]|nr:hypothetical protein [Burkholderiales bacterium]
MSNHDIEGRVPPDAATDAANPQSGAPDSLERQLAKEREARQVIRDRLRHTEALAAESHALRARMAEELERVTADRDRLRAEATIAAAVSVPDPTAATPPGREREREPEPEPLAAAGARPAAALAPRREHPTIPDVMASVPGAAGSPRAAATSRPAHGVEPTMSAAPPARPREDHPIGERPLKPPVRRGPWRALAMLGGLAVAVAGLAWLTGTMPTGLDVSSLKAAVTEHGSGPTPAASTPGLALDTRAETPAASVALAATAAPSAAANPAQRGAVPLPPLTPEAQIAAAPSAGGAQPTAVSAAASVPPPMPVQVPVPDPLRAQSQLRAEGGLDVRLRKALDGEGITSIVQVDPASGHVLVADPQADRVLRDRTDMLIRAVYAGASLPEPQIEHRWISPMHGDRAEALQAQAQPQPAAPAPTPPAKGTSRGAPKPRTQAPTPAQTQAAGTSQRELTNARAPGLAAVERINLSPPGAGGPTRHVESVRPTLSVADAEDLRPVVPAGRITAGCMQDLSGRTSNRRATLSACMKHSCCSSSGNLNSDECRAYQKAYPYTCGAG